MVCVAISPAVTSVKNMPVAARAIITPVESFCIVILHSCYCFKSDVASVNKHYCA